MSPRQMGQGFGFEFGLGLDVEVLHLSSSSLLASSCSIYGEVGREMGRG